MDVSDLTGVASSRLPGHEDAPGWPTGSPADSFAAMAAAEVAIYLQAMLLPDADTFSMASSVELRVPFVDGHVFSAAIDYAAQRRAAPGKAAIATALSDRYLQALATRPKLGFSLPMGPWLAGPLASLVTAASEPDAPVWSVVDRAAAARAGMLPLRPCRRWAEPWAFAALNGWLAA
jgi:asparagine synthase (glutamine-hydrolysing)